MAGLRDDLKHALRLYRRTPGASLIVVAVLAIGMAFVAAFLSLYSDLILRPEPGFEPGSRIVSVGWSDGKNAGGLPAYVIERLADGNATLEKVAGGMNQPLMVGPERKQVMSELISRQFFPGVRPRLIMGHGFTEADHSADGEQVVVISWGYWQEQFGGRPDVLGQSLEINGPQAGQQQPQQPAADAQQPQDEPSNLYRIVGVMDRSYTGMVAPQAREKPSLWLPIERAVPLFLAGAPSETQARILREVTLRGVARLMPGASPKAAQSELDARLKEEDFLQRPGVRYAVLDRIVQNVFVQAETKRQLQLFLGGSVLLALVAAANVSLFLLARAPGRRRELGIRMAVGAPLGRLARQLATEASVLVLVATVFGLALSIWLAKFLRGLSFLQSAQWRDVTLLDWRVLGLVGVFLLLLTLLVSLAPILGLKKLGIAGSSRQVAARATVAQRIAGTAQIAVAGALGGAAIAFAWHLMSMLLGYPGFNTANLYAVPYGFNTQGRQLRVENGQIMFQGMVDSARLREAFEGIPGVTAATVAGAVPGVLVSVNQQRVNDPQDPTQPVFVRTMKIDSHYLGMLGLKLLYGQNISDNDPNGALVNQVFARRFFGREDVVGEPMPAMTQGTTAGAAAPPVSAVRIVGVLPDLSFRHPLEEVNPMVFTTTASPLEGVVLLETRLAPAVLQEQLKEVARTMDLNLIDSEVSLARARSNILAPDRARGFLTIATALLVVLLAAFGFYGTQRYLVMAGRREYAIRASLGAGPRALGRLVLRRGLLLGVPGLVLGLPMAWILVAWLRDDYVSRSVLPLVVVLGVAMGLLGLLLVASIGPARLARRTQPAPLLRED